MTVRANRKLSADFRRMEIRWPASFEDPAPGQFVMVRAGESTDPLWRRPLGVHDFRRRRGGSSVFLLFQVVGPTTRALAGTKPGGGIDLLGPFGRGFSTDGEEHWLVAGGRGVAPLFYLARALKAKGRQTRVLIGGCTAAHVPVAAEIERMGHRVETATEDGSMGRRGLVTDLLGRDLGRISAARRRRILISACGPEGMLRAVKKLARQAGAAVSLSLDTLMACGQGYCQGCTVRTRRGHRLCCKDGPVFDGEELAW